MTFFLYCGLAGLFSGNIMKWNLLILTVQASMVACLSPSLSLCLLESFFDLIISVRNLDDNLA